MEGTAPFHGYRLNRGARSAIYTIFDAKWTYVTSIVLFEIGSAICGAANMMNVEIFGRALGGIGGIGNHLLLATFGGTDGR